MENIKYYEIEDYFGNKPCIFEGRSKNELKDILNVIVGGDIARQLIADGWVIGWINTVNFTIKGELETHTFTQGSSEMYETSKELFRLDTGFRETDFLTEEDQDRYSNYFGELDFEDWVNKNCAYTYDDAVFETLRDWFENAMEDSKYLVEQWIESLKCVLVNEEV